MLYFLAVFLPPLAVLACGKPFQFFLNIGLLFCGVIPAIIHALLLAANHYAEERNGQLVKDLKMQKK